MFTVPEQFSAATKANLESQLAMLNSLTVKAFEGVEKVIELNISAARASLEESSATARQLLGAKDAQEFLALSAAQAQPTAEKAIAYSRHLAGIASSTQAEFAKATEAQIAEATRKVNTLIDEVTKNAPAGSENAIAILKSMIGNASAGYEQLTKTAKQAVETIEANVANATNQFTQVAEKTTARARKQ
ncbi:MAG: TIGR01841 family phasin [Burkholderiaceae bacterium]